MKTVIKILIILFIIVFTLIVIHDISLLIFSKKIDNVVNENLITSTKEAENKVGNIIDTDEFVFSTKNGEIIKVSNVKIDFNHSASDVPRIKAKVRDIIITNLSNMTSSELATATGKEHAKEQILNDINDILGGEREVLSVSFGQFIIQ